MDYNHLGIKEVIRLYPKIGDLLSAYEVDCATCAVGICLMKDVLDIHNFSQDQKQVITEQMDKLFKYEAVDIDSIRPVKKPIRASHSRPIQKLVDEHVNILRLIELAQHIVDKKVLTPDLMELLKEVIFYVINYADKHHHAKEENILFKKTNENQDVIKSMITEHEIGRGYIALANVGIQFSDHDQIRDSVRSYINLLREHIRKEDSILYPWFDRNLSDGEKDVMEQEFEAANQHLDTNMEKNLLKFLDDNFA